MQKSKPKGYPADPKTIGEHIRKKRMDKGLFQEDLASFFGTSVDTITNWENNRSRPSITYFPNIIEFLGYTPFHVDKSTFAGKITLYRYLHGLSQAELALKIGVDESTIFNYEKNQHKPIREILRKFESLFESWKGL